MKNEDVCTSLIQYLHEKRNIKEFKNILEHIEQNKMFKKVKKNKIK
jgi:hypothetical protein